MSTLLAELSERARHLPPEERAQLAEDLFESLGGGSSPEVESVWDAETLKGIDEVKRGEAVLVPAADVFAEVRRLAQ